MIEILKFKRDQYDANNNNIPKVDTSFFTKLSMCGVMVESLTAALG